MRFLLCCLLILGGYTAGRAQILQKVPGLDSRFKETNMSITPNGKYLFFMSQRGGMPWSTRRPLVPGEQVAQYDGDIWYCTKIGENKWSAPQCLGPNVNTYSGEDEPNITADGQGVYFQSWRNGWERTGGPYYRAELNGSEWGTPIGMGGNITRFFVDLDVRTQKVFERDLKDKGLFRDYLKFRAVYPYSWVERLERKGINFNDYILGTDGMAISPDERIFIVSAYNPDKKKYDLFISRKDRSGSWSYPKPLGVPNAGNETTVYIAGDNSTVYFASDRPGGMGGFDIYKTTLLGGILCTPPVNLGAPYNSTRDDYGFVVDPSNDKAYQIIDGDIFSVELLEVAKPEETLVINGRVQDQFGNPLAARIQLINRDDPDEVLATARSNSESGEYSLSISKKTGRYQQSATTVEKSLRANRSFTVEQGTENTLDFVITIEVPQPRETSPPPEPIREPEVVVEREEPEQAELPSPRVIDELKKDNLKVGDILRVDELYFKADSDEMETSSLEVLDEIARVLRDRRDIKKVEIAGHTNGLPPTYYCEQLSSARAKRVYDYLISKSIDRDRLVSKGYGKRDPIASDDTAEGRRKNQRVEIKILEME